MFKKSVREDEGEGMGNKKVGILKKTEKIDIELKAEGVPKTAASKKSKTNSSSIEAEALVAKKQKKVKKVKKDLEEKKQDVSSNAMKKSKNKYKHLAGKGKRMDTLTIPSSANPGELMKTASPKECNMDIDYNVGKKHLKSGLKRKLEESDDVIPQKKAKLKQASWSVVESSGEPTKQNQLSKMIDTATSINSPAKTEKKKKKSKGELKNLNTGVDANIDPDKQKQFQKKETTALIDSPGATKKKQKNEKKKAKDRLRNGNTEGKSEDSTLTVSKRSNNTEVKVTTPKPIHHKSPKQLDKIRSLLEARDAKTTTQPDSKGPQVTPPGKQPAKKSGPLSLKERMEEQLKASRFRYLNEQLYTSDSQSAQELFAEDPEAFHVYHHGYQAQVSKWPANPVDRAISYVKGK